MPVVFQLCKVVGIGNFLGDFVESYVRVFKMFEGCSVIEIQNVSGSEASSGGRECAVDEDLHGN